MKTPLIIIFGKGIQEQEIHNVMPIDTFTQKKIKEDTANFLTFGDLDRLLQNKEFMNNEVAEIWIATNGATQGGSYNSPFSYDYEEARGIEKEIIKKHPVKVSLGKLLETRKPFNGDYLGKWLKRYI